MTRVLSYSVASLATFIATALVSASAVSSANAQSVAAGQKHSMMLTSSGTVWTVGTNGDGQLGDNTTTTRKLPIQVSGLTNVSAIAAGFNHSLALKSDGTLWAWGDNAYGQIGDGSTTDRKVPVQIATLSSVVAMAAGQYHSLAVTASGQVYAWGRNANGQLGTGNTTNASTPVQILASGGAGVGAGTTHTLVVKTDGTAWSTGSNAYGQLGNGNTTQQLSLVQMTGVAGAIRADGGERFSVVLLADGTAKAAGYNSSGQVGDDTSTQRTTAVAVVGLTGATAIAVNEDHTLALTSSGQVFAWGFNSYGRLGDGTTTLRRTATLISALPAVQSVAAGSTHSLAVVADGTLWTWGDNGYYQLGDGTTIDRVLPDTISGAAFSWRVATPTLSVASGTYTSDRTVTIATETAGATIRYTRTGVEPTESDQVVASGGTVTVSETQTVMAKAWKAGSPTSATASATYTMKVPLPSFSPSAGTFTSATNVTVSSSLTGVTFHYTLDGSEPSESSTTYTGPIPIGTTTQLKAIGRKTNWSTSDPRSGTYTMNFGTLAPPTIAPAAGTYEGQVSVTLTSPQSGATIRYTTNGSTPTASSTAYTAPVTITTTTTLKAKVFHPNYTTSAEASAAYTIKVPAPTLSLAPGTYAPGAEVTIVSPDGAATMRVTFTGADPVSTDGVVVSGTTLLVGGFTLKVRATRAGCVDSDVTTAAYTLSEPLGAGALTAGAEHTVLATPQGLLYAWGRNNFGQIGDGSTTTRTSPRAVPSLTGVISLAGGDSHTLALTWDGRVFAWGYNNNGRLGDGTTTNRTAPVPVPSLNNVVAIAAGASHSLALTASGAVYAWGVGTSGQLGQGAATSLTVPTLVPGLTGIVGIAAGEWHSLALSSSGQVYAWGANGSGQLGDGTTTSKSSPVLLSLSQVAAVRAGSTHNLARLHSGAVYAWGAGSQGQLGLGGTSNVTTPTLVTGLTAVDLEGGELHSLGIKTDGSMSSWGDNAGGKLGDGATTDRTTPFTLASPASVALVAAGDDHSVAVTTDGHVWSWGGNTYGQLGDGTTTGQLAPHDVLTVAGTWGATPAPALSLAPGTYDAPQAVAVTAGAGSTIRYTTTGVVPTETDPVIVSGDIVPIDGTLTLSVRAWSANRLPSAPVVATYQLQPPAPTASVPGGLYTSEQTVSLAGAPDSVIYYTLDGSDPTEASQLYGGPLTITATTTVRARAFRTNWTPSVLLVAAYQIVVPVTTISLTAPTDGASFDPPATIGLQALVTSNVGITSVAFYEGTTLIGTSSAAPYAASWPAPGPGSYTFTATATDQFSTVTTASAVSVTVRTLPVISDVSPASGAAGTLVTVTGTDFGATQGASSLWLGSKIGVVETWSDALISARIAAGASSGTVQVRLPDRSSNTLPVTVLTATISNATPSTGGVGTAVTINGSNFGADQGTGHVWLGTAAGVVTSWSSSQIVATIAAGSQTGSVQVIQDGVGSNALTLTVTGAAPRITWLSPNQGGAGTVVTLYGSGFGASQGSGTVRLGSGVAGVVSWSDSQVAVSVPTGAVSGVVKLQQDGQWSNAVAFRVPAASGGASLVSPSALSLVVGETRSLQALDDAGLLVTGGAWTSSDTDIVTLSTADPPVVTAVAPGTATVSVGGASAEVTVYEGPYLPAGTVVWTNGATTEGGLYSASPNYDALADVFAVGLNPYSVTAITADGSTAWTQQAVSVREFYPDLHGGAVVRDNDNALWRLDPLTGAPLQLFSYASPEGQSYGQAVPRMHEDGTVFVVDYTCTSEDCHDGTDSETGAWVVGVDGKTGSTKFRVKLQNSTDFTDTTAADEAFCQFTGGLITQHGWVDYPWTAIVAGDGNYYVPYRRYQATGAVHRSVAQVFPDAAYDLWDQLVAHIVNSEFAAALAAHAALRAATGESYNAWHSQLDGALNQGAAGRTEAINLINLHNLKYRRLCDHSYEWTEELHVMRVGPTGASADVTVKTWETSGTSTYNLATGPLAPWGYRESRTYAGVTDATVYDVTLITDADQGVLMSWIAEERCPGTPLPEILILSNTCVPATDERLTHILEGAVASNVVWGHDLFRSMTLDLQLEDGTFVGVRRLTNGNDSRMKAFDTTGNVKWELPGYWPMWTTVGGLIAAGPAPVELDEAGNVIRTVGELPVWTSWNQEAFRGSSGVVEAVELPQVPWGTSFAAMYGGNPATYGTYLGVTQVGVTQSGPSQPVLRSMPQWTKKEWGATCYLSAEPPAAAPLTGFASTFFAEKRDGVLAWLQTPPSSCTTNVFGRPVLVQNNITATSARDFIGTQQVAFDGRSALMSQHSAGLVSPLEIDRTSRSQLLARNFIAMKLKQPVCALFVQKDGTKWSRRSSLTAAAAQSMSFTAAPPTAVYVNSNPDALTALFSQGTVLHEALHTLTGLAHSELDAAVGAPNKNLFDPVNRSRPSENEVTWRLRQEQCVDPTK